MATRIKEDADFILHTDFAGSLLASLAGSLLASLASLWFFSRNVRQKGNRVIFDQAPLGTLDICPIHAVVVFETPVYNL